MIQVRVKPNVEEKLKGFFPWVYRPEILSYTKKPDPGDVVVVRDAGGHFLGYGYVNPKTNINVRMLSYRKEDKVSEKLIRERIEQAYLYRKSLSLNTNAFRLVHSEGDMLPGLVVDVYGEYAVVEFTTYGMNLMRDWVINALIDVLKPKGIYERANDYAQSVEGFKTSEGVLYGYVPDEVVIYEEDVKYYVSISQGQKTGFFLDQRVARRLIRGLTKPGFRCLDLFCHSGGFAINMKKAGAKEVIAVDVSELALELGKKNERLNGLSGITWMEDNAFDFMKRMFQEKQKFNLIVIDPPSFAKNRASVPNALRGYKELCVRALHLIEASGYMALFSCSFHITEEHLLDVLWDSAKDVRRYLRVVNRSFQDLDHPWLIQMPNTLYLKGVYVEVF